MQKTIAWLDGRREYGLFFVRVIIGFHLIYGVQDNIRSWEQMLEFRGFLEKLGMPFPLFAANLSVWAQFICGICFILGLAFRPAAAVMVINFIVALLLAHRTGGYQPAALALIMLFCSIAFLIHGAGKPSVDERLAARSSTPQRAGV